METNVIFNLIICMSVHGLNYPQFKAAGRNFDFVLILAPTLAKSSMTTTTCCREALDQAVGYPMHWFG